MDEYNSKVSNLQTLIRNTDKIQMYKESMSNTFREKDINPSGKINLSTFNQVISINKEEKYADVEGSTTFETIVDATLNYKLMPAVVPELKTITIGGAIVGLGIESSSFRYGLVHNNIMEVDVILSNGEIKLCSNVENDDLFNALPNSLGSLCYIIRARIKLVPVKDYVHIHKEWYNSYNLLIRDMTKMCVDNKVDFIDGVLFKQDEGVIVSGYMTDTIVGNPCNYKTDGIYYKSLLPNKPNNNMDEYLTIKDYIWRWDYDWFWCNTSIPFIENYYMRKYILGEKYLRSDFYKWLLYKVDWLIDYLGYKENKETIVQDIVIPCENVERYLEFLYDYILVDDNKEHYIWLCPHHNYSSTFVPSIDNKLYIDVAQWGLFNSKYEDKWFYNKLIEKFCDILDGFKGLYSTVHYDRETFNKKYNGKAYDELKLKYDPYNKIKGMYEKLK